MFSRAHLLIEREINEIESEKGLTIIRLDDNNIFELIALIEGIPKTVWERGIFQIYLKFSENYNFVPPKVFFQTVPYHPNIDITTGKPSLDFLDDISKWRQDYSIKHILRSLQHLLAYPLLDRSVNMDAVFMLKGNPKQYAEMARKSVLSTQKIRQMLKEMDSLRNEGLESESFSSLAKNFQLFRLEKNPTEIIRNEMVVSTEEKIKKQFPISFDEYSILWRGIATTKSKKQDENEYLKNDLSQKPNLMSQHMSLSTRELEHQINKQLNEHRNLMYGKIEFGKQSASIYSKDSHSKSETKARKPKIVNYNELNKESRLSEPKSEQNVNTKLVIGRNDQEFEEEVDQLINWTKNIE
ncbi:Ubiquitin-conjugating enzyme E2 U [Brachionus plicatilis]|uniref:Ubiquitin-conjugating enzyme E2 U n=1 Tax=Brachionus plicatilis TaxID=10195 RepID=A0A3M7QNZ5_BRAPC|nr:Ubiquitin-conjugating enzyme E2 U [Brachionus plicatilis]